MVNLNLISKTANLNLFQYKSLRCKGKNNLIHLDLTDILNKMCKILYFFMIRGKNSQSWLFFNITLLYAVFDPCWAVRINAR